MPKLNSDGLRFLVTTGLLMALAYCLAYFPYPPTSAPGQLIEPIWS